MPRARSLLATLVAFALASMLLLAGRLWLRQRLLHPADAVSPRPAGDGADGGGLSRPDGPPPGPAPAGAAGAGGRLRIAILSLDVGREERETPRSLYAAIHSKRCYAERHGYTFILHTERKAHDRTPHWTRVLVLQRYLPRFDWVLYLDYDTMIVNGTTRLEDFVQAPLVAPSVQLILNEGDHVNSGGFFIRNSEWSLQFLRDWWAYGESGYQEQHDQGALVFLLLDHVNRDRAGTYDGSCRKGAMGGAEKCWVAWMNRLGLPLDHRRTEHVLWWPCHNGTLRGFSFYGHGCWLRHECQCYRNGDFLAHTHALGEWNIGFTADACPAWRSYLHAELSVDLPDAALSGLSSREKKQLLAAFQRQYADQRVVHAYWFGRNPYLYALLELGDDAARLERTVSLAGNDSLRATVRQTWTLHWDGVPGKRKQILRQ